MVFFNNMENKINNKKILFLLFFVSFSIPAHGMDRANNDQLSKTKANPAISFEFLNSFEDNFPYEMGKIYQNEEHSRFASEQFVCNQKHIINAMNDAAQRKDTKVHLTVGAHGANDMSLYEVTTLKRKANAHGKMTVALKGSPIKTDAQKGFVHIGSNNGTNSTWQIKPKKKIRFNLETGVSTNDPELAEQAYQMILSQSPIKKKKEVIELTPKKPSLFSSKKTDLNKSLAQRLDTLAKDTSDNRSARIQTMNINDEEVVDAAIKAKKSGADIEFIANHTALTKYGTPLLQKLDQAGIPVHIFCPDKDSQASEHSKAVDIIKGTKYMHLENTGNVTDECAQQTNYTLLLPNNKDITMQSIRNFETVKTVCKPLAPALQLKEKSNKEQAEKKAAKRKAEQEAQSAPDQKKKKTK